MAANCLVVLVSAKSAQHLQKDNMPARNKPSFLAQSLLLAFCGLLFVIPFVDDSIGQLVHSFALIGALVIVAWRWAAREKSSTADIEGVSSELRPESQLAECSQENSDPDCTSTLISGITLEIEPNIKP